MTTRFHGESPDSRRERTAIGPVALEAVSSSSALVCARHRSACSAHDSDLLPHLDFDMELFHSNLARINPEALTMEVSARTGAGLEGWADWLAEGLVATTDR